METQLSSGAGKVVLRITDGDGGAHPCKEHMTEVPEHKSGEINALFVLGRPGWNDFANPIQIGLNKNAVKPHVCGGHIVMYHVQKTKKKCEITMHTYRTGQEQYITYKTRNVVTAHRFATFVSRNMYKRRSPKDV